MFINSISSLLSASIKTFPFLRLLNVLIPIFIFNGSIFFLSRFLISSAVLLSFGFTVSLCRSAFFPDKTFENSFVLPPLGGVEFAVRWLVGSGKLVTDGASCLTEVVDIMFSKVFLSCLTSFRDSLLSSDLPSKSLLRENTSFLRVHTDSWIECFNSFFKFPLFSLDKQLCSGRFRSAE